MSTNKKTLDLLAQELEKVNATLWAPKGGKGVKSKEAKEVGVVELTKIANCLASALNATKAILEDIQVDEEKKAKKMEVMEAKLAEMDKKNNEVAKQLEECNKRVKGEEDLITGIEQSSIKVTSDANRLRDQITTLENECGKCEEDKSTKDNQIMTLREEIAHQDDLISKLQKEKKGAGEGRQRSEEDIQAMEDR